jgi:hypothetical protein
MHRRFAALTAALLFGPCVLLAGAGPARAHNLDAACTTRTVRKIQVEGWYSDDRRPKGATVQVYRTADGQLLTEGRMNADGVFVFFADPEPLRVVVDAGEGHRKELAIEAGDRDVSAPLAATPRDTGLPVKDVLLGVALLLAVAAFGLSLRNARRLRELNAGRIRAATPDAVKPNPG